MKIVSITKRERNRQRKRETESDGERSIERQKET
jgi:hypothetical protein